MDPIPELEALEQQPFQKLLGIELMEYNQGYVKLSLPFSEELGRGDGENYHGGALSALLDTAVTYAVISDVGYGVPTANLRIDYLRPSGRGRLIAEGWVIRAGSNIAFAEGEIQKANGEDKKAIARAQGILSIPARS